MAIKTYYMVCQTTKRLTPKHISEERAGCFILIALMIIVTVSDMLSLSSLQWLCLACNV